MLAGGVYISVFVCLLLLLFVSHCVDCAFAVGVGDATNMEDIVKLIGVDRQHQRKTFGMKKKYLPKITELGLDCISVAVVTDAPFDLADRLGKHDSFPQSEVQSELLAAYTN